MEKNTVCIGLEEYKELVINEFQWKQAESTTIPHLEKRMDYLESIICRLKEELVIAFIDEWKVKNAPINRLLEKSDYYFPIFKSHMLKLKSLDIDENLIMNLITKVKQQYEIEQKNAMEEQDGNE